MPSTVDLDISGMTCASCAARIEKKLNRLDGVTATVNYATEKAHVTLAGADLQGNVIDTVAGLGYTAALPRPPSTDGHSVDELRSLRQRFIVCTALTVPVLALVMVTPLQLPNWQWLALILTTPVVVWGAWPFHVAAWRNARHGLATMDTLISIGVLAAYGWSLYALFFGNAGMSDMHMTWQLFGRHDATSQIYLEVAAGVTCFILAGRYFEAKAKQRSGQALRSLLELGAKSATVVRAGVEERLPIDDVVVGDRCIVKPGEKIPTDGVVREGASAVDQSLITGESTAVEVGVGDVVWGASVNTSGRLVVEATRVGDDTRLAQIGRLVEQAQSGKADVQRLADRVSAVFVPVVLMLALLTLVGWLATGASATAALSAAIAVLIIACPCALGLATPTALLVGTGRGAQLGIVIKGPQILEDARAVDTILLDKTGTITTGRMSVVDVVIATGEDADLVWERTTAVESASEHPIATAIVDAYRNDGGQLRAVAQEFDTAPGGGASGIVDAVKTLVGKREWLDDTEQQCNREINAAFATHRERGYTSVGVAWAGRVRAVFALSDTVKPTSRDAIASLKRLGLRPVLLTGDHITTARMVAREVGIAAEDVLADVTPEEKIAAVQQRQLRGEVVAMAGDGVNDAAALAQADLGIAMGSGSDIAIEASDLTIVRSDLAAVPDAIMLSRRVLATIKANLFWAFGYNVAAIPLAAAGLLNPLIASVCMAASSLFVVSNSLRLRRFTPSL